MSIANGQSSLVQSGQYLLVIACEQQSAAAS